MGEVFLGLVKKHFKDIYLLCLCKELIEIDEKQFSGLLLETK